MEKLLLCDELMEFLEEGKSRISRLWLGPLHIEALFRSGRREEARERLAEFEALVSDSQSPRCEQEVIRLKELIDHPVREITV